MALPSPARPSVSPSPHALPFQFTVRIVLTEAALCTRNQFHSCHSVPSPSLPHYPTPTTLQPHQPLLQPVTCIQVGVGTACIHILKDTRRPACYGITLSAVGCRTVADTAVKHHTGTQRTYFCALRSSEPQSQPAPQLQRRLPLLRATQRNRQCTAVSTH